MGAIILSKISSEIVLHFPSAKDLRITGLTKDRQEELRSMVQLRFCPLKPEKTLEIYGVDNKSLKDYARDNKKHGFSNLPPIKCRLRDLEYKGTDDDFEVKKKKEKEELLKVQQENESLDMDFDENRFSMKGDLSYAESTTPSTTSDNDSKDGFTAMGKDFRGSIAMKRRATVEEVKLEDFDIKS